MRGGVTCLVRTLGILPHLMPILHRVMNLVGLLLEDQTHCQLVRGSRAVLGNTYTLQGGRIHA